MSKRKFDLHENLAILSKQLEINEEDPKYMLQNLSKTTKNSEDDPISLLSELGSKMENKSKKSLPKHTERRERKKDSLGYTITTSKKYVPKKQYKKKKARNIDANEHTSGENQRNNTQERQDLLDMITDFAPQQPVKTNSGNDWTHRRDRIAEEWSTHRQLLMNEIVEIQGEVPPQYCCTINCFRQVTIRCRSHECSSACYLCNECDTKKHQTLLFHDREVLISGMYKQIPASTSVFVSEESHFLRDNYAYLKCISSICSLCSDEMEPKPFLACILITMTGRHDVYLPKYECKCGFQIEPSIRDILFFKLWPASPVLRSGITIYDQRVLYTFTILRKESPSLSVRAFIATLQSISEDKGKNTSIDTVLFNDALREWQYQDFEMDRLRGIDPMQCPACSEGMHACHVDGNRKIYRYAYNTRSEELYYGDLFIARDEDVDRFVQNTRKASVNTSDVCGESHWKAAKAASRGLGALDETGMVMACCRHTILYKAVNMHQGEIFAYPLYLHMNLLDRVMEFFCQDVICRYFPWLKRLCESKPEFGPAAMTKPFLSVMHAKAHDWSCQVTYGGRLQTGAGMTTGEELELVNSNISRYGFNTKKMTKASRHRTLTNAAIQWNKSKIKRLGMSLAKRYKKMTIQKKKADAKLEELLKVHEASKSDIQQWSSEVKDIAKQAKQKQDEDLPEEAEYYLLKQQLNVLPQVEALQDEIGANELLEINKVKIKNVKNKVTRCRDLESRLTVDKEIGQIQQEGRHLLLKSRQRDLQNTIEETTAEIRRKTHDKYKFLDSSKQRMRINRQLTRCRQRLAEYIRGYNKFSAALGSTKIDENANENTIWPWISENSVDLKTKIIVMEAGAECDRIQEELVIIQKEMKALILHCGRCMEQTEQEQLRYFTERKKQECFHYLPNKSKEEVIRGLKCLQQEGYFFWSDLRNDSIRYFKDVLGESEPLIIFPESDSESDEPSSGEESIDSD